MADFTGPLSGEQTFSPNQTANSGTAYANIAPPRRGFITRLLTMIVSIGTIATKFYVMRPVNTVVKTSAATPASWNTIFLTSDPGLNLPGPSGNAPSTGSNTPIAANHYIAYEQPDGSYAVNTISGGNFTAGNLTLTSNVTLLGIAQNANVWFYGNATDSNPRDPIAAPHPILNVPAQAGNNTLVALPGNGTSTSGTLNIAPFSVGEPLVIVSSNPTGNYTGNTTLGAYSVGYTRF